MPRVLLINPPSPERSCAPPLGLEYLAAALLDSGCEVRVIDAAAQCFDHDDAWIAAETEAFAPDVAGLSLYTNRVLEAYRLAERLRGRVPLLVAGGPHATACPEEALARGFDAAVCGEADETLPWLVEAHARGRASDGIPGIRFRGACGPEGDRRPARVPDLDALPPPHRAWHLFDRRWYTASDLATPPAGVMASRGCPARCVFCANYVSGRRVRFRAPAAVVEDINLRHRLCGQTVFPFWDEAVTADPARLRALLAAFAGGVAFPLRWSGATRANMISPGLAAEMRAHGCYALSFGAESGDDAILRAIGKGLDTRAIEQAVRWAHEEGLAASCNFMLGFPQEDAGALARTLEFMQRLAPMVQFLCPSGAVVPFPGTPLYEQFHRPFGFTGWWLRPVRSRNAWDAAFERDFFRYPDAVRAAIADCLRFARQHNESKGLAWPPVTGSC